MDTLLDPTVRIKHAIQPVVHMVLQLESPADQHRVQLIGVEGLKLELIVPALMRLMRRNKQNKHTLR
jgi:hypothetical protein